MVLYASLARKSSSVPLCFTRSDYPEMDPEKDRHHIAIHQENGEVKVRNVPLNFFGELKTEYEKRNQDYIEELKNRNEVLEKDAEKVLENGLRKLSAKGGKAPVMRKPKLWRKTLLPRRGNRSRSLRAGRRRPAASVPSFTIRTNASAATAVPPSASATSSIPPRKEENIR